MSNIPKGIAEQVNEWQLSPKENREMNEELEKYFTLRKERIESNHKRRNFTMDEGKNLISKEAIEFAHKLNELTNRGRQKGQQTTTQKNPFIGRAGEGKVYRKISEYPEKDI